LGRARFALACLLFFSVPLLLCVPVLGLLRYDASEQQRASDVLRRQIANVDAQIVDLKDLNRVKANVLVRKQIVEEVRRSAGRADVALDVAVHLPPGVQLQSLKSDGDGVVFALRTAVGAELGLLARLAQHQLVDLQVSERRPDKTEGAEQVTITARSPGGGQ
jgi:Tfp pilus assembly protein PilN